MSGKYDPLCEVIQEWVEMHKALTLAGTMPQGIHTPNPARHSYLYDAGMHGGSCDGQKLWDEAFAYIREPEWPEGGDKAFDARVRAGAFELLREWQLVFNPKSRNLWTPQHRANVLKAVANSAQRIADRRIAVVTAAL